MKIKFYTIYIIVFLLIVTSHDKMIAQNKLESDSQCVQTNENQALELFLVNELSISYKEYFSNNWFAKINVDASALLEKSEEQRRIPNSEVYSYERSNFWIGTSLQIYHQILKHKYLSVSTGLGPSFKYKYFKYKDITKFSTSSYVYGAIVTAQIEIFIYDNIFLIGKYDIQAEYEAYEKKYFRQVQNYKYEEQKNVAYNWNIHYHALCLGISVYF